MKNKMNKVFSVTPIALAVFLAGCNNDVIETTQVVKAEFAQTKLDARGVDLISTDGYQFKDLNKNGILNVYEDWRKTVDERVGDLVSQMTLEEKVGMMLIDTMNAAAYGSVNGTHVDYIEQQKMTRFIFRNAILPQNEVDALPIGERAPGGDIVTGRASASISPSEAAQYMNIVQELSESTRLGIPALFKSNARNHNDPNARAGINVSAGAFSEWPKEAGLAATRDMELIGEFAQIMRTEWNAIGLRGMYGYMADLSTEPRWYRVHETFTEDSDLASEIMTVLVSNLQGKEVTPSSVVLTMKHFPGGGPQFLGLDPHYMAGQHQSYPTGNFDYHVKPFKAAIDAGVAALMPYYGIVGGGEWSLSNPDETNLDVGGIQLAEVVSDRVQDTVRVPYNGYSTTEGTPAGNVGIAFSKGILSDLLRRDLGFSGVINSDTGIIGETNNGLSDTDTIQNNRAWGLQDKDKSEQLVVAIEAGTDVFSGFHSNSEVRTLVEQGLVSEARIDESVKRLLKVQFELGLFENPYVDPVRANAIVGNASFQEKALLAQRKAVVLLDNKVAEGAVEAILPLPAAANLYTMGMDSGVVEGYGYTVTNGDLEGERPSAAESDYALIRVRVTNKDTGLLVFGGADFKEVDVLDFTGMAAAGTWDITPSLTDIQAVMAEVGAENTVLSVYFRQPFVMDEASGLKDAGAILATFGSKDNALMDVVTGGFNPSGKLPFALANSSQAIIDQASDAPGYAEADTLYPFGFGLSYE
ncbi:glycoside hydrolase, family 3 domain protein [Psychromonas ingrahamii 37]|uniref:beta-glucosidase n=1 Tax=Psychromonas ingrahamii (strain DSM 17664 / CCUG 51855 / 37) TaxID=357804 RepID=A1SR95_PSYIN|nr:glycoside hydrolase family 3 N-terminal domain-containing protein [Psychromonas ingrahamii]ABM02010.1 glycoside hydrolase, family 3 domain protein [Psychromonas ingrahamii 37]